MRSTCGRVATGLVVLSAAFSLGACGLLSPGRSAVGASPTSGNPAASTAPASAAPSPSVSFVPMQTAKGGEFASPSGNISCEVDYHRAGLDQASCQTGKPARSVTLKAGGTYKTCTGQQCLGDAGTDTPTLAYGSATGVGPFRCESTTAGVTCLAHGKGFQISTEGVVPKSS